MTYEPLEHLYDVYGLTDLMARTTFLREQVLRDYTLPLETLDQLDHSRGSQAVLHLLEMLVSYYHRKVLILGTCTQDEIPVPLPARLAFD